MHTRRFHPVVYCTEPIERAFYFAFFDWVDSNLIQIVPFAVMGNTTSRGGVGHGLAAEQLRAEVNKAKLAEEKAAQKEA